MRSWGFSLNLIPNPSPQMEKGAKKPIAYFVLLSSCNEEVVYRIPFTYFDFAQ